MVTVGNVAGSTETSTAAGGGSSAAAPRFGAPAITTTVADTAIAAIVARTPIQRCRRGVSKSRWDSDVDGVRRIVRADIHDSTNGRAAHTTTRPLSSPTLAPNSVGHGASRIVDATATAPPNTIPGSRPAGVVLGSVIMKNRKISVSGEVTRTHQ